MSPVPKTIGGKTSSALPPESLEAVYAACVLRERRLLVKDTLRAADELKHTGLRQLLAAISAGQSPEDATYDASVAVKDALSAAREQLPREEASLEQAFGVVCRRLKLRAVEEQLQRITRETAGTPGASDLTEDARALLAARGQLLSLKRELLAQK